MNKEQLRKETPTPKTIHLFNIMADLFGGKWERENGRIGEEKFYSWAERVENLEPDQIRSKFTLLEQRFKKDVSIGKDIWPPTIAYFMALNAVSRPNADAYKKFKPKIMPYTISQYKEMGARGLSNLKNLRK